MNEMEEVPTLTGHPVVVQFALQVLLAGHERLQGELQLLPVERLLHAEILRGNTTERHLLRALRRCSASPPTFSSSCCDACSSVCPDLIQFWP